MGGDEICTVIILNALSICLSGCSSGYQKIDGKWKCASFQIVDDFNWRQKNRKYMFS